MISSDGQFALSGSWDGTLRLWDLSTGATTRRFLGHTKDVLSVAFSVDNRQARGTPSMHLRCPCRQACMECWSMCKSITCWQASYWNSLLRKAFWVLICRVAC